MANIDPARLEFSGHLSLRDAAELKSRLTTALAGRKSIVIQTDGIDSIDMCCLQVLVAAQKSANAVGTRVLLSASARGPLGHAMIAAGFHAPDGRPLIPEAETWTLMSEAR